MPEVNVPHTCVQCPDYPCVEACNFDSLSVDEKTGAVVVDEEKCTGCGACVIEKKHELAREMYGEELRGRYHVLLRWEAHRR